MTLKPSLIIIAGPTGIGKTAAAIALAEQIRGEIISADAMQVYRHMDIGTAKPTPEERARVPHHLIDVVEPDEDFSAARFREIAAAVIQDLETQGKTALVVGGTGLYIKALTQGLFVLPRGNKKVRQRLLQEAGALGSERLYQRLQSVDPATASRLHPNDTYRIVRALEVLEVSGKPLSAHHAAHGFSDRPYRTLKLGLSVDRQLLYDRINERVDQMVAAGLLQEVERLLSRGCGPYLRSMQSIGYRHMVAHLKEGIPWEETINLMKRDTRRYAKRQLTWFKGDPEILWVHPDEREIMMKEIERFLAA